MISTQMYSMCGSTTAFRMQREVVSATKRASNPLKFLVLDLASQVSEVSTNICDGSRALISSTLVTCRKSPDFAYNDTDRFYSKFRRYVDLWKLLSFFGLFSENALRFACWRTDLRKDYDFIVPRQRTYDTELPWVTMVNSRKYHRAGKDVLWYPG
jgi:hypothetical protein